MVHKSNEKGGGGGAAQKQTNKKREGEVEQTVRSWKGNGLTVRWYLGLSIALR